MRNLPPCARCGEPAALNPAALDASLAEAQRWLRLARRSPKRSATRIVELGRSVELLELLRIRERDGLCSSCARIRRDRNKGEQLIALGVGAAVGAAVGPVLRPELEKALQRLLPCGSSPAPGGGGGEG